MQLPNNKTTLNLLVDTSQEAWEGLDIEMFKHISDTMLYRVADVTK